MIKDLIYFSINAITPLFTIFLALYLAKKYEKKWLILYLGGLLYLAAGISLQKFFPDIELNYITWNDYIYFNEWAFLGGFFALGVLYTKTVKRNKRAMAIFLVFMILFFGQRRYMTIFYEPPLLKKLGFKDDICMQSTGYTCSAAACATLLKFLNIESSEYEMAALCRTTAAGTFDAGIVRGLRIKLKDHPYSVKYVTCNWDELKDLPKPLITNVLLKNLLYHSVVVKDITEDLVAIADPLHGHCVKTKEDFLEGWEKMAVIVEKVY